MAKSKKSKANEQSRRSLATKRVAIDIETYPDAVILSSGGLHKLPTTPIGEASLFRHLDKTRRFMGLQPMRVRGDPENGFEIVNGFDFPARPDTLDVTDTLTGKVKMTDKKLHKQATTHGTPAQSGVRMYRGGFVDEVTALGRKLLGELESVVAPGEQLAGIPAHIIEAALTRISVTTMFSATSPHSPFREIITEAIIKAYEHGLREGCAVGELMTATAEEMHVRRTDAMTHLNVVATMWATGQQGASIKYEDLTIASWITGARMFTVNHPGDGSVEYKLDFDEIRKGYKAHTNDDQEK